MSAEKSRPEAIEAARHLNATKPSVTADRTEPAEPAALIGATVETRLAVALARLQSDEISLDDLTPALQGYVLHGHRLALASLLPEYTRLETALVQATGDADRYYSALFNPRQTIKLGPSYAELEITRAEIYSGGAR
ncbi:hypothetical protein [Cryobacterium sp. MDB2-10]|uniref:hypothetical protein n=1 Tax=Cryobacterium sp. MDB2-10 TaxID=1259177 RepID=UPI0010738492|nr:hypothetical protein [Cryobacterium sp. MDB2-10]TFC20190.1 hypothetical protein E3O51_05600 [Cryobacterium sp. MDB2-10]